MEKNIAMTEREFVQLAEAIFSRIELGIDACGADIECNLIDNVLEIEFENSSKIIINRHSPNQEIWVAAKTGGFHFSFQNSRWVNKRDGSELFSKLSELVQLSIGMEIHF